MPSDQVMHYCFGCGGQRLHLQRRPSHVLHLLLTVFTLGLWAIVWLLLAFSTGRAKCTTCGQEKGLFNDGLRKRPAGRGAALDPPRSRPAVRWVVAIVAFLAVVVVTNLIAFAQ